MTHSILEAEEHVLSTLERDGSRTWLRPRLSHGFWLTARRVVAYGLIAIFTLLPFLQIGGKPAVLLDIVRRQFTLFGYTFLPTDFALLAILLVGILIAIFLMTALFGRVWCGWACPQTVYMEFVFRPIERLFDGTIGRGGQPGAAQRQSPVRWIFRYAVYAILCFYLANTFLAYFVGVETLWQWVHQSPLSHPVPFIVVACVTVAMMFDFCFFREQLCIVACPYGRFQSVLLDRHSLIVSYDRQRGEPRGHLVKLKKSAPQGEGRARLGDCIDCRLCVVTCPTGIDIRDGLQMECVNCTQCIDACNVVMSKIGRPPNLIRFSSQAADEGQPQGRLRPRVLAYPLLLLLLGGVFVWLLLSKPVFDAVIIHERGNPYTRIDDATIRNVRRLKLTNRQDHAMQLQITTVEPAEVVVRIAQEELQLAVGESRVFHLQADAPAADFRQGRLKVGFRIENQQGQGRNITIPLTGPMGY